MWIDKFNDNECFLRDSLTFSKGRWIHSILWNIVDGGSCTTGNIRLVNSYTSSYGRSEGRVEVCYNNEWGTICDYDWGTYDVQTACYELGYSKTGQ